MAQGEVRTRARKRIVGLSPISNLIAIGIRQAQIAFPGMRNLSLAEVG